MRGKRVALYMLGAIIISISGMALKTNQVKAATSEYVANLGCNVKQKAGGKTFVAQEYKEEGEYKYKIVMKSEGKTSIIALDTACDFVTNGNVIYYTKRGVVKNTIMKCNLKTGKKSRVISKANYMVRGCSGKYLYCGIDEEADGTDLYALNLRTKKKKHMVAGVGRVIVYGKYVVTDTNTGAGGNFPINVFKLNGFGKKKIADGGLIKVSGNKIYYSVMSDKEWKFKIYTCTLNGKNKKVITGWVTDISSWY